MDAVARDGRDTDDSCSAAAADSRREILRTINSCSLRVRVEVREGGSNSSFLNTHRAWTGKPSKLSQGVPNRLQEEESRQTRITELVPPRELGCDNIALGSGTHFPSAVNRYWCTPAGNSSRSVKTPSAVRTIGLASGDQLLNSPATHTF